MDRLVLYGLVLYDIVSHGDYGAPPVEEHDPGLDHQDVQPVHQVTGDTPCITFTFTLYYFYFYLVLLLKSCKHTLYQTTNYS